ncbi:MAG: stage II sporulation protein M [Euryarchaeota archaeon]|nr:stage II sporulation protein M [Euryarchaeota archaeon]
MNWKDDVAYLRSIRGYILLSVLLFAGSAILGFVAASRDPQLVAIYIEEIGSKIGWILGLSPPMMMGFIFLNNLFASTIAMLLGIGFGIVPALVAVLNGVVLGVIGYHAIETIGVMYLVAAILPHGIIELPTVLICIGVGFRLGHLLLLTFLGKDVDLGGEVRFALRLLRWVVLFLFLAAVIETLITPIVIQPFIDLQAVPVME